MCNTFEDMDYQNNSLILLSDENKDHNAWTEMYNSANFHKWLLRFEKP